MPNRSPFLSFLTISSILFISSALVVKRECSPESRAFTGTCPDNINYVCAYFTGGRCDSGLCQKLATNECNACKDPSVEYYTAGLCEAEKIYCDDKNRDLFPSCNDYSQACGYSTRGCLDGECALYSGYLCDICRDLDITYFKPGECPRDERVFQCQDYCDPSYQSPVCMMKAGCTGDDCTETYKDRCQGCQDYPNSIYKEGPCQKDRVVCDPDGNSADCDTVQDDPVCAYFRSFDYDNGLNLQQATVKNGCTACKDPAVNYYTPGECEFRWEDQRLCLPNHVEQECGDEDEPVCGYYSDNGVQNFPNSCSACQNNTIKFYRGGTCRNYCRTISTEEVEIIKCNGSLVEPVCTYEQVYSDDGNGNLAVIDTARYKTTSVRNSCAACFDIPLLDTVPPPYRDGLCPGDQGILCENEPTSFYYGSISPVCGLFDLRCSDSSCRKTFSEPLAACGYSMAVMYIPGYCPGDQGISCDLYRDQFRRVCEGMDTYRIPVCGYTRKDCNDDSCRANYQNQCYACSESSVTFFTKGACGN